jgi:TonB family protein
MRPSPPSDLYSRREIALAAGVREVDVIALLGPAREFVPHEEAVRVGRILVAGLQAERPGRSNPWLGARESSIGIAQASDAAQPETLAQRIPQLRSVPLAVSTALHVGLTAFLFLATFNLAPRAAALKTDDRPPDPMRLVFLATPGPGGGGGGGGLLQKAPPPKAMREGRRAISSPIPQRVEPKPIVPAPAPPEPKPQPLKAEPLPVVVAPIVTAPADNRSRIGVLAQTTAENDSHGPGTGGGAGSGRGTGLGEGDGSGIGPGSGGGTGGGPYRPGSGIDPPRLLQEVKASYTDEARRQNITGDVELEIVVRRDGTVGDVRVLRGLGGGLNDRAVQAVRQWRFSPAHRQGVPVDVIVEVALEFKLR